MTSIGARLRSGAWRSRAFLQPLVLTIGGVLASALFYAGVARYANGPADGPCTVGPDACGYMWMGSIGTGLMILPVFLVGLVGTGLVVGLSGHDARLAVRAIVAAVLVIPMAAGLAYAVPVAIGDGRDVAFRIVSDLAWIAVIGLAVLAPIMIGFALARLARR